MFWVIVAFEMFHMTCRYGVQIGTYSLWLGEGSLANTKFMANGERDGKIMCLDLSGGLSRTSIYLLVI